MGSIRVEKRSIESKHRTYERSVYICRCDTCDIEFERLRRPPMSGFTYCSRSCQYRGKCSSTKAGQITAKKISEAQRRRLDDSRVADEWKRKLSESNKHARAIDDSIVERMQVTYVERYGEPANTRMRRAFYEKYSVDSPSKLPHVCRKLATSMRERHTSLDVRDSVRVKYGVDNVMQLSDVVERQQDTVMRRFGVKSVLELPWVKARAASHVAQLKKHATMKRNGTYAKSRAEEFVYAALLERFPVEDVMHQAHFAGGYRSDFFVVSMNVYIQVDGVYWHGLDITRQEVSASSSSRAKNIIVTMDNDAKQNAYYARRPDDGSSLLRVSDRFVMRSVREDVDMLPARMFDLIKDACDQVILIEH